MHVRDDDQEYTPARLLDEIREARVLALILVCVFFLFVGSVWDHDYTSRKTSDTISLYEDIKAGRADAKEMFKYSNGGLFQEKTFINLLKELGFASGIAFILIIANEIASHNRHMRSSSAMTKRISENVFRGVFGIDTPREVVKEAVETIFRAPLVRSGFNLSLSCSRPAGDGVYKYRDSHFIVDVFLSYKLTNLSSFHINEHIPLSFDIYTDDVLSSMCRLMLASIGDAVYNPGDEMEYHQVAASDDFGPSYFERRYNFPISLKPSETAKVMFRYRIVKSTEDSEVLTSAFPTIDGQFTLTLPEDCKFEANAMSRHRHKVKRTMEYHNIWELTAPLLPLQSVTIWWRPRRNDDK